MPKDLDNCISAFEDTVVDRARSGDLLETFDIHRILSALINANSARCPQIFEAIYSCGQLDTFLRALAYDGADTSRGVIYSGTRLKSSIGLFCQTVRFDKIVTDRLRDKELSYPARAAYDCYKQQLRVYAVDGSKNDF